MHTLHLAKDCREVLAHLRRRVKDYTVYINPGPGEDEDDITLITLGYCFEQYGWYALVFDTRPEAAIDGEWQEYIEETRVEKQVWCMDDVHRVEIKHYDPAWREPKRAISDQYMANLYGQLLKKVLVEANDAGLFQTLPLAAGCVLCIEEFEGRYGWADKARRKPKRAKA